MKKILDPKNLPYAGAIAQAVLFSIAGNLFFPAYGWLAGLGVGAIVNYSIALASSRINDISEKRKGLARLALIIMLLLSPATITLSLFMPKSVFTALSWAVCVDLSIVLAGAITGKSMIPQSVEKNQKATSGKQTRKSKRVARQPISNDALLGYFAGNPGATDTQVAKHFNVTRQAIGKRREKLYKVSQKIEEK